MPEDTGADRDGIASLTHDQLYERLLRKFTAKENVLPEDGEIKAQMPEPGCEG